MDHPQAPRVIGERYRLLDIIGRGGMGVVWTAQDELLNRLVAIKEVHIPDHLDDQERNAVRERTMREARAAAGLASASAVTVHDVLDDGSRPWIVMERLLAPTLADALRDSGPIGEDQTIAIGLALLGALEEAHAAGLLHRDIKPANVMLTKRGAVLTDFGIAHQEGDPSLTTTGVILGSPTYLAPERARGEHAGVPADMWSLGATLFAAVEGHAPFERDGQLATLHAVVNDPVPEPVRARALGPVLLNLLDKDPRARPSLAQTRELLERASRGEVGVTQPIPVGPTTTQPASPEPEWTQPEPVPDRRRPGRFLGVAGVVTLLMVALAVFLATILPSGDDATDQAGDDPTRQAGDGATGPAGGNPTGQNPPASAPAPFESTELYEFTRYLFRADECSVPSPEDFAVAYIQPDAELLKCSSDTAPYTGTFWCKDSVAGVLADRRVYLDRAVTGTEQDVLDAPAGQDAPADGVQVAFNHVNSNNARVYWDSPAQRCAGELQGLNDDVAATVEYWRSGSS